MDGFSAAGPLAGLLAQNSSLSAASCDPGGWDAFGTFTDGTLAHWWNDPDGGPMGPHFIGQGFAPAGLCAIAVEAGRLDVFGVDQGGGLQHYWGPPGDEPYSNESLGGQMAVWSEIPYLQWTGGPIVQSMGGPSAVWPGLPDPRPGHPHGFLHVFAISADGSSLLRWILGPPGDTPGQPETIPAPMPLAPLGGVSAVSWAPGRVDVFAAAANGTLLHWWADHGQWDLLPVQHEPLVGTLFNYSPPPDPSSGPFPALASPLCAVSWAPQRLDVFGAGTDRTLQHWWYSIDPATGGGNWCGGADMPEPLVRQPHLAL